MSEAPKFDYEAMKLSDFTSSSQALPSVHPRVPFHRQASMSNGADYAKIEGEDHDDATENYRPDFDGSSNGLGLEGMRKLPGNIKRVPVGSKKSTPDLSKSSPHFLTPESSRHDFSQATTHQNTPATNGDWDWVDRSGRTSRQEFSSQVDLIALRNKPPVDCPTEGDILTNPWSSYAVPILIMSVYSTIFSGIFLGIALAKPRWGQRIGTKGRMSYATATLLSALFSKTVELSFVAVFVTLLGQMLSRRAIIRRSKRGSGVNLSEMTMRLWVTQPGTLITHLYTLRYAALTLLGGLTLLATIAATFYTTAAEALVAPKLTFGPVQHRVLGGSVIASFANADYLKEECETPVTTIIDPDYDGTTCLQISYAGQSFHNFQSYLADWGEMINSGNTSNSTMLSGRPPPFAMLSDNTTVTGQWITPSHENITADSEKFSRLVQNTTMAMPHANIFGAAQFPDNNIIQPSDLAGQGEYELYASVPSPAINVLCVGMEDAEVDPLIYGVTGPKPAGTINATAVDDIFRFNQSLLVVPLNPPPQFPKKPIDYNTLVNSTETYGTDSVWVLAHAAPSAMTMSPYVLCSVKTLLYPNCTTKYHVTVSGGDLSVHCDDDPENTIPYLKSQPLAPHVIGVSDWKDIGSEWQRAVALSDGVTDSNTSMARLLTQFVPSYQVGSSPELPAYLPSIGESLGVLAGCTALMASAVSPFIHYWNYSSSTTLDPPQVQYFNATVKYKDFASGASQEWQGIFYLVLLAVFAINLFSLCYLMKNFCVDGQVTDYTEPQNLFAIAMQSQPSPSFSGSCGGGPQGRMLSRRWRVDMHAGGSETDGHDHQGRAVVPHPHFYVRCPEDDYPDAGAMESVRLKDVRKRRSRPKSMSGWWESESPAAEQYKRLAG